MQRLKSGHCAVAVVLLGSLGALAACASANGDSRGGPRQSGMRSGPPQGGLGNGRPSDAMLKACRAKASGDACTADGVGGTCSAPNENLPLACVSQTGPNGGPPDGAGGPPGGGRAGQSNSGAPIASTQAYTRGVLCNYAVDSIQPQLGLPSKAQWSCLRGQRTLTANSIPDHAIGAFPNHANPNTVSQQSVSFTVTTSPVAYSGPGGRVKEPAMALNGVKFDPGTGGSCAGDVSAPADCPLGPGSPNAGPWRIEALGQDVFDFGVDQNNAHVQPTGHYHYHGIPEGMLSPANRSGKTMQLIGWAADGFPIYARYGYVQPNQPTSGVLAMRSSYRLKTAPDKGRPSTALFPMGTFTSDWEYAAGSGDLDECNGRFAVTPEFPEGIYHYYATDTYPYVQRCVKGSLDSAPSANRPPAGNGRSGRKGRRGRGDGDRPPRGGGGRGQ